MNSETREVAVQIAHEDFSFPNKLIARAFPMEKLFGRVGEISKTATFREKSHEMKIFTLQENHRKATRNNENPWCEKTNGIW